MRVVKHHQDLSSSFFVFLRKPRSLCGRHQHPNFQCRSNLGGGGEGTMRVTKASRTKLPPQYIEQLDYSPPSEISKRKDNVCSSNLRAARHAPQNHGKHSHQLHRANEEDHCCNSIEPFSLKSAGFPQKKFNRRRKKHLPSNLRFPRYGIAGRAAPSFEVILAM